MHQEKRVVTLLSLGECKKVRSTCPARVLKSGYAPTKQDGGGVKAKFTVNGVWRP